MHDGWIGAGALKKNRFYILNLQTVIGKLGIAPTTMSNAFKEFGPLIAQETEWAKQVPAKFGCNHTHIQTTKQLQPKQFGHAVTIIFVLDKYAQKIGADFDVYDYLRIIPAQYFIDGFDKDHYNALVKFYAEMKVADRIAIFGDDPPPNFDVACLNAIDQPPKSGLILQMAWGFCVTRYVADHVRQFINSKFPKDRHVGLVLASGQESNTEGASSKNAASDLRVPRLRAVEELVPLPLRQEPKELDKKYLKKLASTDPMPVSPSIVGIDWAETFDTDADGAHATNGGGSSEATPVAVEAAAPRPNGDEPTMSEGE
ncbi:MAG: hypothetical protein Q8R02_08905 [Hyphomonadaceae bacterium]|nr:hypothetical protein [Hyphomonadaceae bacterium]